MRIRIRESCWWWWSSSIMMFLYSRFPPSFIIIIFLFCQFSSDKWRFSLKKILKEQKFRSLSLSLFHDASIPIYSVHARIRIERAHIISFEKKRFVCEMNLCACSLPSSSSSTSTTTTTTTSINHSHQSLVFFHAKKEREREMESTKKKIDMQDRTGQPKK